MVLMITNMIELHILLKDLRYQRTESIGAQNVFKGLKSIEDFEATEHSEGTKYTEGTEDMKSTEDM